MEEAQDEIIETTPLKEEIITDPIPPPQEELVKLDSIVPKQPEQKVESDSDELF